MKKDKCDVSVIVVNYNGEKFIKRCLESVFANSEPSQEVIVVENGSSDKSLSILKTEFKKEKNLKIIPLKKNAGPAKARNIAAKKAIGEFLLFLDCDTIADKNFLIKPINFLKKNKKVGAAQLKILKMGTSMFDSAGEKITSFGFLAERARGARDNGQFDKIEEIFSGKTAAMIIRKDVFEKLGGFDEDLFMYWEEPDLCWRIWKLGYKVIFLPTGKIWHAYGTNMKKVSSQHATWITYQGCKNQISTIIKNAYGFYLLTMLLGAVASYISLAFLFLIKGDIKKAKAILKALLWIVKNIKALYKKRAILKKQLGKGFASDKVWFNRVTATQDIKWYIGKGISYVLGKPF